MCVCAKICVCVCIKSATVWFSKFGLVIIAVICRLISN